MKRFHFLLMGLLGYFPAVAQDPIAGGQLPSLSSNGGGGGGSGIYHVDLYTGSASVNIPILNYEIEGVDAGVSLGYDCKGIKVDQTQGRIGLGWFLHAGGSITRITHGLEDEVILNPYNDTALLPRVYGKWHNKNEADGSENELDEFVATFGNKTIRFNMGWFRSTASDPLIFIARVYPRCNVSVTKYTLHPNPAYAPGQHPYYNQLAFKIVDEMGNQYFFEQGVIETKEYRKDQQGSPNYVYNSIQSWNLKKVVTRSGKEVNYEYDNTYTEYDQARIQEVRERYLHPYHIPEFITNKVIKWRGWIWQVNRIDLPNGKTINFEYDKRASFLNYEPVVKKIKIRDSLSPMVYKDITYQLNHAYFQSPWRSFQNVEIPYMSRDELATYYNQPDADSVKEQIHLGIRLQLKSITKIGMDGVTEEPYYKFGYQNLSMLPRRLSPHTDLYGYYNGKSPINHQHAGNQDARLDNLNIPLHLYEVNGAMCTTYGQDKNHDLAFMQIGTLNSIENGTGGTTFLSYKDHVLYNPANGYNGILNYTPGGAIQPPQLFPANGEEVNDGLCIDYVLERDGFNKDHDIRTEYSFSDGQRFFRGGYFWRPEGAAIYLNASKVFTNYFVNQVQPLNGSNHGYSYAEVKRKGFENQLIGSVKYRFTNLMLYNDPSKSNLMMRDKGFGYSVDGPSSYMYQYRMGHPLEVEQKDAVGALLSKSVYAYADSLQFPLSGSLSHYRSLTSSVNDPGGVKIYTYFHGIPFRINKLTEISYTNNGQLVKETKYGYNYNGNLNETIWTDELGQVNKKKVSYLFGYSSIPSSTELIRTIGGLEKTVDYSNTIYSGGLSNLKADRIERLINDEPTPVGSAAGNLRAVEEFTRYNSDNIITESKDPLTDTYQAILYDNRNKQNVAVIANARLSEVAYTSFEGVFLNGSADPNRGNWNFDPIHIEYAGPAAAIQPMTGRYFYNLGRNNEITSEVSLVNGKKYVVTVWATEAPNVNTGQSMAIFTEQLQAGNWKFYTAEFTGNGAPIYLSNTNSGMIRIDELRLYPADAEMATVTHEPLCGPQSTCDGHGNISYFEYDAMGRQTVTRDVNRNVISASKHIVAGQDTY
jgi:hypothetical protein